VIPLDVAARTCIRSPNNKDDGYNDNYRGWYDVSGCGTCNDYCRWVGNSGSGGDPSLKTSHKKSYWSCRKAGTFETYSGDYPKPFNFKKCSKEGVIPPQHCGESGGECNLSIRRK